MNEVQGSWTKNHTYSQALLYNIKVVVWGANARLDGYDKTSVTLPNRNMKQLEWEHLKEIRSLYKAEIKQFWNASWRTPDIIIESSKGSKTEIIHVRMPSHAR